MVTAVHYFATLEDQMLLLDYLGEPAKVTLHPWPLIKTPLTALSREEALEQSRVMVMNHQLGSPVPVRPGDAAMQGGSVHAVFNRLNWEKLAPAENEALMDSNASPTILWSPARLHAEAIFPSSLGSQADSMAEVSKDYERWVNRSMSWIRRNGTRVWGLEGRQARPDLDIELSFISTVFALPDALQAMESGTPGRDPKAKRTEAATGN
ncbi:hypothetical protein OVA06_13750 [Pseudarthrobacter sp. SL88]|uniref:hypothetical protein n=1 Tax=Pseudarthrobacter sp. SL88 TaxID=2994666 RepID=UPI00227456DD|nr:hypothetical protein [Pseudarthrobacter sp. SL88]MCY1675758.1 hypothetical protein [Pseudarthrobacter sp. SL88]